MAEPARANSSGQVTSTGIASISVRGVNISPAVRSANWNARLAMRASDVLYRPHAPLTRVPATGYAARLH